MCEVRRQMYEEIEKYKGSRGRYTIRGTGTLIHAKELYQLACPS